MAFSAPSRSFNLPDGHLQSRHSFRWLCVTDTDGFPAPALRANRRILSKPRYIAESPRLYQSIPQPGLSQGRQLPVVVRSSGDMVVR
jgi:hypothetical protein